VGDKRGETALAHARAKGQSLVVAILERHGAR
jgi:hypothetical protein